MSRLELVACVHGPGSFTGLRIGVTTAKMLGYAIGCPVVALNALDVIARQARDETADRLDTILNAQRKQLFVRSYERLNGNWHPCSEVEILESGDWLSRLDDGVAVSGPDIAKFDESSLNGAKPVDRQLWAPRAATVAALGILRLEQHGPDDIWTLSPQYYRKSYAE